MAHQGFVRQVSGSEVAVLMIHGIVGSPSHFQELVPVIPESASVYNILLDGHGGTVKDFATTSMQKWKNQVNSTLETIFAQHKQVVIVAHSMGTLFALQAAIDHPDKIAFLFLLNVPTRPRYPLATAVASMRTTWGRVRPQDRMAQEMRVRTSVTLSRNLLAYVAWAPRFWELLVECRRVRLLIPQLQVPAYTYQARVDELVSFKSVKDLEGNPHIQNTILEHSGHFAYRESDLPLLQQTLYDLLTQKES